MKAWEYDLFRERRDRGGGDEAARILKRIIKDLKKELEEKNKKKPDEKKKEDEWKFSTWDYFVTLTALSIPVILFQTYWIVQGMVRILETLLKVTVH